MSPDTGDAGGTPASATAAATHGRSKRRRVQQVVTHHQAVSLALDLSENIATKNEIKFFEGLTTSFDLSQAQRQLYVAQQDYLQSMLNILLKRVDLETLINTPPKN